MPLARLVATLRPPRGKPSAGLRPSRTPFFVVLGEAILVRLGGSQHIKHHFNKKEGSRTEKTRVNTNNMVKRVFTSSFLVFFGKAMIFIPSRPSYLGRAR